MQTLVLEQAGQFALKEMSRPVPGPGEALVRVHRAGICGTDLHAFAGRQPLFSYPRVIGHELGVEVIDPGDEPRGLQAGMRCAVEPYLNCGECPACTSGKPNCCQHLRVLGVHSDGGLRPFFTLPSRKLHPSSTLSYDQLALVETLAIGAHAVERGNVRPDDHVLVVGAGPIGLSVIQFVREIGARLAVMDTSDTRLAFCREKLGVTLTMNPATAAVNDTLVAWGNGMPSVVFDATGNQKSMERSFELPGHGGRLVFVGLVQGALTFDDPAFHRRELTVLGSRNALPQTFRSIIALIEQGRIDTTPWITHRLDLTEVPARFPSVAKDPSLLKAMVSIPLST